jgi:tetratricopeptide (TPR) repeat protein
MVKMYDRFKETPVAGHFLFHAAVSDLGEIPDVRLTPAVWRGLYHLLMLIEHHSSSPLWDDAVWMAAEQLAAVGRSGDEARLLESVLLPQPGRGTNELAGAFSGKVRLRLAGLYEQQGQYDEALYQLGLVVNIHPDSSLKDDALWQLSRIHATCGEFALQRKALQLLVLEYPWSRHDKAAREQLKMPVSD